MFKFVIIIMKKLYIIFLVFASLTVHSQEKSKDTSGSITKKTPKRDLLKELLEADLSKPSKASKGVKDITGLPFKTGSSASIPEKYREIALENNWNPNSMNTEEMEKEYNSIMRKKYLRWLYLTIGTISLISSIKFIRTILK